MSSKRIITLGFALGCAVVAAVLVRGVISKKPEQKTEVVNTVQTTDVLVAGKDIHMGEKFAAGSLSWRAWPKDNVLPSMITKDAAPNALTEFAEARARLAVYEGETILDKKVVKPGSSGFMSAILPKGMRAIAVSISSKSSAGGFILPDDRVDVILTKNVDGGGAKTVKSETVISNVRVLAVNQVYRQAAQGEEVTVKGETATLELQPHQAEIISMVQSSGELSLALRSIAENDGKSAEEVGPQLAAKYDSNGENAGTDTLFMRYGVSSYATNQ